MTQANSITVTKRNGVAYSHHPQHRNNWPDKSQWRISEPEEYASFTHSLSSSWFEGDEAWGIHTPDGQPDYLGVAQDHLTQVFIAKFVDTSGNGDWHGYPADHQVNAQDRPAQRICKLWMENNVIPRRKLRQLIKGQPCKL